MPKSKMIIIYIFIILLITTIFTTTIILFLAFYEPLAQKIPTNPYIGKITLTSDGCCFWAADVNVSLIVDDDYEIILINQPAVYQGDIFKSEKIPVFNESIKIKINFTSHYDIEEHVILIVHEYENTDFIMKNGILLTFGDGNLEFTDKFNKKLFCAAIFGDKNTDTWFLYE